MICRHSLLKRFLFWILFPLVFSSCLSFGASTGEPNDGDQNGLAITIMDAYHGVKDGNVESVSLPEDSVYVTVEICVENRSAMDQSVQWENVFLMTGNNAQIFPVALGYDQAEAFSWILPYVEPIGGKRIVHSFYFFLIQNHELMNLPAYQSLGCSNSAQFKSLALLFLVQKEMLDKPYTLHFLDETKPIRVPARRP